VQHDGVVATLHIFDHGSEAVSIGQVGIGGACMGEVEPKAMGPTIVYGNPIVGVDGGCRHWVSRNGW